MTNQTPAPGGEWLDKILSEVLEYFEPTDNFAKEYVDDAKAAILQEIQNHDRQAFRAGQLDCQNGGRVDNHVAYKETVRQLLERIEGALPKKFNGTVHGSEYEIGRNVAIDQVKAILNKERERL